MTSVSSRTESTCRRRPRAGAERLVGVGRPVGRYRGLTSDWSFDVGTPLRPCRRRDRCPSSRCCQVERRRHRRHPPGVPVDTCRHRWSTSTRTFARSVDVEPYSVKSNVTTGFGRSPRCRWGRAPSEPPGPRRDSRVSVHACRPVSNVRELLHGPSVGGDPPPVVLDGCRSRSPARARHIDGELCAVGERAGTAATVAPVTPGHGCPRDRGRPATSLPRPGR
jgi:hypothetical protein